MEKFTIALESRAFEAQMSVSEEERSSIEKEFSSSEIERSFLKKERSSKKAQRSLSEKEFSFSERERRGSNPLLTCLASFRGTVGRRKRLVYRGKRPIRADGWNICVNYAISSVRASDLAPRERTGALSAASQGRVRV
jgi:hypothetical protein